MTTSPHDDKDDAPTIAEDDARLIILRYACNAVMCWPAAQGILLIILSTRPRDDEPMRRRPTGRQANMTTSPCDDATTSPCNESPRDHVMTSPRDFEPTRRRAHSTRCRACFIPQRRQRPVTARTASIVAAMRALMTTARRTTTPCYRHDEGATTRPPSPPLPISEIDDGLGGGGWDEEDPSSVLYLALPQEWCQHLTMRQ
jgi:hypothetical protein